MDKKFDTWLTYLEFLHRIGRRVGCNSPAKLESMKMTRVEQEILSGLMLKSCDKPLAWGFNHHFLDDLKQTVEECLSNNEESVNNVCNLMKEHIVQRYYHEIEILLLKQTPELEQELINGIK